MENPLNVIHTLPDSQDGIIKRRPGRPKGAKNKGPTPDQILSLETMSATDLLTAIMRGRTQIFGIKITPTMIRAAETLHRKESSVELSGRGGRPIEIMEERRPLSEILGSLVTIDGTVMIEGDDADSADSSAA